MSRGFMESVFYLFSSYLFLHIITIITFYLTFKYFYAATKNEELYLNLFKMILFPPAVIRSIDSISKNLFEVYHPLAVIFILGPSKQFYRFSQKLILDLKYPLKLHTPSEEIQQISEWYRIKQLKIYNYFLKDKGVILEQLLIPAKSDEYFKSFCPRCLTKYLIDEGKCSECHEIQLINLEEKHD